MIFSCTWVAVHPNIPCPKKRDGKNGFQRWIWNPILSFAEHRLLLFVCALLVPEYVLAWAIQQYLRARKIANGNECEFITSEIAYLVFQHIASTFVDDAWILYDHGRLPSL